MEQIIDRYAELNSESDRLDFINELIYLGITSQQLSSSLARQISEGNHVRFTESFKLNFINCLGKATENV